MVIFVPAERWLNNEKIPSLLITDRRSKLDASEHYRIDQL